MDILRQLLITAVLATCSEYGVCVGAFYQSGSVTRYFQCCKFLIDLTGLEIADDEFYYFTVSLLQRHILHRFAMSCDI